MITKSNSSWLETFINVFANKDDKNEEQHEEQADTKSELSTEAEINVQSLPTVMWNDNKFYVQLDPESSEADVLNEYGNVVTTIKNVNSVEDVDAHLNDSKIVAAKCELSDADLDKVAKMLHMAEEETNQLDEADKETTAAIVEDTMEDSSDIPVPEDDVVEEHEIPVDIEDVTEIENIPEEPEKEEVDEVKTDIPNCQRVDCREEAQTDVREVLESTPEPKDAVEVLTEEVTPEHECECGDECECEDGICQCAEGEDAPAEGTEGEGTDGTEAMRVSIKSLQNTIASLQEKIAAVEQLYARTNPGNAFDLESDKAEMKHVEDEADAAAEEIALEHTVDISTPEGRCSLKQNILDAVDDILNEVEDEEVVDEVVEDDIPEDVTEEVSVEPIEEITQVVDDVPAVVENTVVDVDEPVVEVDEDVEVPAEDVEDVDESEDVIVELDEKDSNIFKNQVCPVCGQKELVLSDNYGNFQGVICESCGAEFGVNTDTEEIFHKE